MVKRSWRSLLAGAAIFGGLGAVDAAFAGGEGCTPCGGMDCQQCEQIFADAGQKLTEQLASMSCCGTCGDPTCCAPAGCCTAGDLCGDLSDADLCGEGCADAEEDDGCGFKIGGWVQMGYHNRTTPLSVTRNDGLSFNSHPHRFNLQQGWLYAEREADGSEGFDWGFRADLMYGVDAKATQAFGNNPGRWDFQNGFDTGAGYGWAIPQVYAQVASGDLSIIAGHFYTLVGYEVVTAPDNFFYSHALTMFNSEPFTHTGVLATYSATDDTEIYGGWTAGWDTGFDRLNGGSNFLGGFSTSLTEDISFTYIGYAGNLGWRGDGYGHSLVFDFTLTDKLNYVLQSDLVRTNNADADLTTVGDRDDDLGINQYLIYTVNDKLGVGTRMEWWKNEGVSQYASTWGVNVTPMENLVVRPEVRYDWRPQGNFDQTTFGVDAIITF